jgi:hypothetical protein
MDERWNFHMFNQTPSIYLNGASQFTNVSHRTHSVQTLFSLPFHRAGSGSHIERTFPTTPKGCTARKRPIIPQSSEVQIRGSVPLFVLVPGQWLLIRSGFFLQMALDLLWLDFTTYQFHDGKTIGTRWGLPLQFWILIIPWASHVWCHPLAMLGSEPQLCVMWSQRENTWYSIAYCVASFFLRLLFVFFAFHVYKMPICVYWVPLLEGSLVQSDLTEPQASILSMSEVREAKLGWAGG